MKNFQIGQQVQVTFTRIGRDDLVFTSEIMDIVNNHRWQGIWVDHPECRGEDIMYINLSNPNINKVEAVKTTVERDIVTSLKEIKKDLNKALSPIVRYGEEEVTIFVKVYDCNEDDRQTFDVEIQYWLDGEYTDCFVSDTFYVEKEAVKRAKEVLRTVKNWFNGAEITIENSVEVYHV